MPCVALRVALAEPSVSSGVISRVCVPVEDVGELVYREAAASTPSTGTSKSAAMASTSRYPDRSRADRCPRGSPVVSAHTRGDAVRVERTPLSALGWDDPCVDGPGDQLLCGDDTDAFSGSCEQSRHLSFADLQT
jgi:hypothetical protein